MAEFSKTFTQATAGTYTHKLKDDLELAKVTLLSVENKSDEEDEIKSEVHMVNSTWADPTTAKFVLKGKPEGSGFTGEIFSKGFNKAEVVSPLDNIKVTTTAANSTYRIFGTGIKTT